MSKKSTKQPKVPDALIDALEIILARDWERERYDYYHCNGSGEPGRKDHFFLNLEVIRHWLDYVEEECGRG